MRDYILYIKDILEALEAIENFIQGMDFTTFRSDDKTSSAVVRKLEIIGEASKHIPEPVRQQYPDIPWKEMAGMRDNLFHFYFVINYELFCQKIQHRLPKINDEIQKLLEISSGKRETESKD